MTDIAIVGAGIAGLTAAVYARRAGCSAKVFEKMSYGGQIINALEVENYPGFESVSGLDLSDKLYNQATALGAETSFNEVVSITPNETGFKIKTSKGEETCGAVIVAVGSKNRELGVQGEREFIGRGVSYCATCDGAFFKGKEVAVVGGGNAALDEALYLSEHCSKVYLIHRRDEFRAHKVEIERARDKDNIEFILEATVESLKGTQKLESLELDIKGKKRILNVSGLFVAVGRAPETEVFSSLTKTNEGGYIIAGEDCLTSAPGIFAAGDCRTKSVRQLVTAAADGAVAALAAVSYVKGPRK